MFKNELMVEGFEEFLKQIPSLTVQYFQDCVDKENSPFQDCVDKEDSPCSFRGLQN